MNAALASRAKYVVIGAIVNDPSTFAVTASFSTNQMTVTATAGNIGTGQPVGFSGVSASTTVTGQISGTPGGAGTYSLSSSPGTIASASGTLAYTGDQIWDSSISGGEPGIGYVQAIAQIIANGQTPILQTEYGQNGLTNTNNKITQIYRYNQIVREFCATGAAICLDFASAMWNPNTTTASVINFVANTTQDGTHSNQLGAYLMGRIFVAAMTALVPPLNSLSNAPGDQALPNNLFLTQSGGTLTGGGTLTSGTIPSGWTLQAPAGVSVVSTFTADPGGYGYDWTLAITNTAGANPNVSVSATSNLSASPFAQYQAGGLLGVAAGATGFNGAPFTIGLYYTGGNYNTVDYYANNGLTTVQGPASGAYTVTSKGPLTPALPAAPGGNSPYFVVQPSFTGNGAVTLTLSRLWLRQI